MEELIRFQAGIRSLTDKECISFCSQFLHHIGRDSFATIIFNHLKYQIENDESKSQLPNEINAILKAIINARTKIAENVPKAHICRLSQDLIANIGSYLLLNDHINFTLCNRLIYISVQTKSLSISKMQLNSNQVQKYCKYIKNKANVYKNRFKMIKNIGLNLCTVSEFDSNLFPNIQKLYLLLQPSEWPHDKPADIDLLYRMNLSSLNELDIINDTYANTNFMDIFNQIESNIEYVKLEGINNMDHAICKLKSLKQIVGLNYCLTSNMTDNLPNFINYCKHQLQSLHVNGNCALMLAQNTFVQLKELCIGEFAPNEAPQHSTASITNKTDIKSRFPVLERIHVSFDSGDFAENDLNFFNHLWTLKSINYISVYKALFSPNMIDNLTGSISLVQRNRLKIRITIDEDENVLNGTDKITELIHNLDKYNEHFMFIFECKLCLMEKMYSTFHDKMKEKYLVNWSKKCFYHDVCPEYSTKRSRMIVSNIDCNICGYDERWIYNTGCISCLYGDC
eukprot:272746_1